MRGNQIGERKCHGVVFIFASLLVEMSLIVLGVVVMSVIVVSVGHDCGRVVVVILESSRV